MKKFEIKSLTLESSFFDLELKNMNLDKRMKKAAPVFGLFLFISICCIFVPFLHFILVPGFLIFGSYKTYLIIAENKLLDMQMINCPVCKKNLNEKNIYFSKFPIKLVCFECGAQLTIEPSSSKDE